MRAARFHGQGDIRIEEVEEPATRPGAVKIAVEWCGICGTDLHEYLEGPIFIPPPGEPHPLTGEELPVILGHEFSGIVSEVGDGVDDLAVGDPVVVEPYHTCGECPPCRAGRYNTCQKLGFIGLMGGGGGLSEYVVVDRKWIHPIGNIPTDHAALVEPLAVAHHAVKISGIEEGQTAVVFGAGPIGLVTIECLDAAGAGTIIAVEPAAARKERAGRAGADHVLDPTEVDVPARVLELTGGEGADRAFECAGIDAVMADAVASVRAGGTVVNVAIWGHAAEFDFNSLVMKEVNVVGTLAYCGDHEETIELLGSGQVDAEQLITAKIGLDDLVSGAFEELVNNKVEHVKILVSPTM
ncbi:2,3-butanediol dehydrogenase [Euzebya tangerina]|uniref:2,3-butanediol dehydrogenase n=1 Tax=Euzebya tangerina TaxID=591198 RepID=UPI000E313B02|nr:2,3-butanediol dehydrogenase [Euzebya tangerina]